MDRPIDFVIRAGQADTTDALREYATRRVSFALRRFEHRIRQVSVRLIDLNGARRWVGARCSMTVDLVDGRRVFVDATDALAVASIALAAARLNSAVRREISRASGDRRSPQKQ